MIRSDIQQLKPSEISSDVFIVAPSQIEYISKTFGDALAESMNVRPLSGKISQMAHEILLKTLKSAKTMGEQISKKS